MPGVVVEQPEQAGRARKPTKNELRRAKKKTQKHDTSTNGDKPATTEQPVSAKPQHAKPSIDEEIIYEAPTEDDPLFKQFATVFENFTANQAPKDDREAEQEQPSKPEVFYDDDENVPDEDEEEEAKLKASKKANKKAKRLTVAQLKTIVDKPEAVEWTDVTSAEPKLLVSIKSSRNVVPVPAHWNLKREYLSSKRGIEKQNFRLPAFIAETGISELRQSAHDLQADGSLKQKQRERVNPTLGKFDIDYQKLFEAFFRRQTKPSLTKFGEVYYEGKEFEADMKHLRPGEYSDSLREALNMPLGAPPPWLINMQRWGPPPSYPAIALPGVNAPLPYGAKWGLEVGNWGKPPLAEDNNPRWGGSFIPGEDTHGKNAAQDEPPPPRGLWGEMQILDDEEEEEEEDDEEDEEDEAPVTENAQIGRDQDISGDGLETPFQGTATEHAGTLSLSEGFDIRKQRPGNQTEDHPYPRQAGTVLKERSIRNEGFFGGERAYDISNSDRPVSRDDDRNRKRKAEPAGDNKGWHGKVDQDDLNNMIAEESAKRLKRDRDRR